MKTAVIVVGNPNQSNLKDGMKGYIDGYVRGGDDVPYAVVVSGEIVDLAPTYMLKATGLITALNKES